jgi:hypothetical protein
MISMRQVLTALLLVASMLLGSSPACSQASASCPMMAQRAMQDCCRHTAVKTAQCCCDHDAEGVPSAMSAPDQNAGKSAHTPAVLVASLWGSINLTRSGLRLRAQALPPPDTPVQLRTTLLL